MENKVTTLDEIFTRSRNIFTACFIELWDGVYQETGDRAFLIKSLGSVESIAMSEALFAGRFEEVIKNTPIKAIRYGIDTSGILFAIFEYEELKPIQTDEIHQKLSIFIKCLQTVSDFNDAGIYVSDLSIETLRITSAGNLALFGAFSNMLWNTDMATQSKLLLPYLAPKLKMGSEPNAISDVFSCGVLGYVLFCGKKFLKNTDAGFSDFVSLHPAPSKLHPDISPWVDAILAKALDPDTDSRFRSVDDLLSALERAIREDATDIPDAQWAPSDGIVVREVKSDVAKKQEQDLVADKENTLREKNQKKQSKQKRNIKHAQTILKIIWGSTIVGVICLIVSLLLSYRVIEVVETKIPPELERVMPIVEQYNLRSALLTFIAPNELLDVKRNALNELVGKDVGLDIAILQYLDHVYVLLPSEYVSPVQKILSHWLSFFGYQKGGEIVDAALFDGEEHKSFRLTDIALSIIHAANQQNAKETRISHARLLFQKYEKFSFTYVAALAEESSPEIFIPVLRDFLSARGFIDIPSSASKRVLFMLAPETRDILGGSIEQLLKESTREDLKYIATALLSNTMQAEKEFFGLALKAYLASSQMGAYPQIFVDLAQKEVRPGSQENVSMFRLILGTAEALDLAVFIEWDNANWEKLMYATLVTNTRPELLDRAFEIISRRGPTVKVAKELLTWIKKYHWSVKSRLAFAFGVFALKEIASEEELHKAFDIIMPISNGALFHALVATEDPYFISQAIERIGPIVKVDDVFPLLSHLNSEVRIAAVKSLIGKNDLSTLQKILAAFHKEKDPQVIQVYNEFHWVTRDRQKPQFLTSP